MCLFQHGSQEQSVEGGVHQHQTNYEEIGMRALESELRPPSHWLQQWLLQTRRACGLVPRVLASASGSARHLITPVTGAAHIGAPAMAIMATSRAMPTRATPMSQLMTTTPTLTCRTMATLHIRTDPACAPMATSQATAMLRGFAIRATTLTLRECARPVVIPT